MFWLGISVGMLIGIYLSIGFTLATGGLKHIHKPTFMDYVSAEFLMLLWLPLAVIGAFLEFYDYLKGVILNG